jgi:hypothetical protein
MKFAEETNQLLARYFGPTVGFGGDRLVKMPLGCLAYHTWFGIIAPQIVVPGLK